MKNRPNACIRASSRRSRALLCAIAAGLAFPVVSFADTLHRFAIIAGNNTGGGDMHPLFYAVSDASKLHAIFTRIGGVHPEDAVLLLDKTANDLRAAFDGMEPRMAEAESRGEKSALIVFYSGHAKDGELRMGASTIPLEEVKRRMSRSVAEIRIGFFDSCRSGSITRTKGARKAPAFEVDAGAIRSTRGVVILASSAADEDSQESDQIEGSFFSHNLASGLLGSADISGDGKVSLSEAYAYAYDRTVADTAGTAAGAQHPTYSYDLAGNGDVILTDVLAHHEGVLLPAPAPEGEYFLVSDKGAIAAEVIKTAGFERRIALAPGLYRVKRRMLDRLRIGEVTVRSGETTVLDDASLHDAAFSDDPVKGDIVRHYDEPPTRWSFSLGGTYQGFLTNEFPSTPTLGVEVAMRNFLRHDFVLGFDAAIGGGHSTLQPPANSGESALGYGYSELTSGVSVLKEFGTGTLVPSVGVRIAMIYMARNMDESGLPSQNYFATTPGLVGALRWQVSRHWSISGRVRVQYLYYDVDREASFGYIEGSLLASFEL
jgi:hypothetical protein